MSKCAHATELCHHGIKGMKWGVRKAKNGPITKGTGSKTATDSQALQRKRRNAAARLRRQKYKEETDRMIKALEQHERAMKMSLLSSAAGISLQKRGNSKAASFITQFGKLGASVTDISAGYNFWR